MKRKALVALVLLMVVTLLAGCGGVSQKDLDAAVADKDAALAQVTSLRSQLTTAGSSLSTANTAKAAAEASLATAQAALTKANSDLTSAKAQVTTLTAQVATLTAKVTALEKEVADLKAAAAAPPTTPPTTPPAAGFTGTKYSDTTYGFSFQYPTTWAEKAPPLTVGLIKHFGNSATYSVPCVYVLVVDQSTGATLEAAFKAWLPTATYTFKSFTGTAVTIGGVACTKADVVYTGAYGDLSGTIVGFTKNNKWVIIGVIELPALGGSFATATQKNDVVNSITIP